MNNKITEKIFCVKMHKRFFLQHHSIFDNIAGKSLIKKLELKKLENT